MNEVNCLECVFWSQRPVTPDRGLCRRYAPRPFCEDEDIVTLWPQTDADDWCGEAIKKKVAD